MTHSCFLQLANGWTVSISAEGVWAMCSVAAWPTALHDARFRIKWFEFNGRGDIEVRCRDLAGLRKALNLVNGAAPPVLG